MAGGFSEIQLSGMIEIFYILIEIWCRSVNAFVKIDQTVHLAYTSFHQMIIIPQLETVYIKRKKV